MLGAIIGDLAASQWQLDTNDFYKYLITDKVLKPTEYGVEVMYLAKDIVEKKPIDLSFYSYALTPPVSQGLMYSRKIMDWYLDDFKKFPFNRVRGVLAITAGMIGWTSDSFAEIENRLTQLNVFGLEKDDWYAIHIMAQAVFELKIFNSKKKISSSEDMFYGPLSSWDTNKMGLLADVTRAWKCFESSFDFTSAIHNAVKSKINPHLTAVLTGMFAEAMYGCRYVLLKSRYTGLIGYHHEIQIPENIGRHIYGFDLFTKSMLEYNKTLKIAHRKNNSETDVEIHKWVDTINAYEEIHLTDEQMDRIFYGFSTDAENPYGFFQEEGRFYLYGNGRVYARFYISDERFWNRIVGFQTTGNVEESHYAMNIALHSVIHSDYLFKNMPVFSHYGGQ